MASMKSVTVESDRRLRAVLRAGAPRQLGPGASQRPARSSSIGYDGPAHKGRREADSDGAPAPRADAPRNTRGARARPQPMVRSLKTRKR